VQFVEANVLPKLPFEAASFDAVVDTFGLCSFEDPVAALREMGRVLKPGGRLFLLEHGASSLGWLSRLLDSNTPAHVHKHGCFWNRDIDAIVAAAGMGIVERERRHAGTTYYIVASPPPERKLSEAALF